MLGWSINLFRIFGIQLAVHATFFLLLALEEVRSPRAGVALVVGGTLSALAMLVLDPGLALLAATAGAVVAAAPIRRRERSDAGVTG